MTSTTAYAPEAYKQEVFGKIRSIPDNQRCFDCRCKNGYKMNAAREGFQFDDTQ